MGLGRARSAHRRSLVSSGNLMTATTPIAPDLSHIFNDDLLTAERDRQFARDQFPNISHVLDHPSLREAFARYEAQANYARGLVRLGGFLTIAMSSLTLVSLAIWPLFPVSTAL